MYFNEVKVLIVEDEKALADSLSGFLQDNGLTTEVIEDGSEALQRLDSETFDAIILDWLLPGIEGIDICRALRERHDQTPILMLTAQSGLQHRIQGLSTGADDYVTKPFHPEEILVRVRALIRRSQQAPVNIYRAGGYTFSVSERSVQFNEATIELSEKEADILTLLFQHQDEPVDRKTFLQEVWGYSFDPNTNVVEVYIRMLRAKLADIGEGKLIRTKRGEGYYITGDE